MVTAKNYANIRRKYLIDKYKVHLDKISKALLRAAEKGTNTLEIVLANEQRLDNPLEFESLLASFGYSASMPDYNKELFDRCIDTDMSEYGSLVTRSLIERRKLYEENKEKHEKLQEEMKGWEAQRFRIYLKGLNKEALSYSENRLEVI